MSMVESVDAPDWEPWIAETGGRILDIREPWEWEKGTLPDATLIPMGEIPGRLGELDTDQALLVVCRSGGRSQQVALYLAMNGFTKVANMAGGMKALGLQE
ncbi:MAG TPA: rhodanese-like domain-containing protein [Acidimicrobiia bacterium]|nr:rhodanese-like domain-containing protein [Acidimicrobiia bacterium]